MTDEQIRELLGYRLRAYRALRGMTIREAARKIEIQYQKLGRWELGQSNIKLPDLVRVANGYGVTVGELVADIDARLAACPSEALERAAALKTISELRKDIGMISDRVWSDVRKQSEALETLKKMEADLAALRRRVTGEDTE